MTTDWLSDDLLEPLAIAICYGEFLNPEGKEMPPRDYWASISVEAKADYVASARRLMTAALAGCRIATRDPSNPQLQAYMQKVGITDANRARKQYVAMHQVLPTLWKLGQDPTKAA